ncbi:conserved hypothetical protein [Legionella longbeachae D-4968]|nr:conserved hypothetical protein [Legionella longbeachae D-4968]
MEFFPKAGIGGLNNQSKNPHLLPNQKLNSKLILMILVA